MAIGLETKAGQDFDEIYELRATTKIPDVGIQSANGVDISNRYEKAVTGIIHTGTAAELGWEASDGTNLNSKFARKGSANLATLSGTFYSNLATASSSGVGNASVSGYIEFQTNGGISSGGTLSGGSAVNWLSNSPSNIAAGADYEIRFSYTVNSSSGVSVSNGASSWMRANANRRFTMSFSSSSVGSSTRNFTVTIELRRRGFTTPIVSNTVSVRLQLSVAAAWNGDFTGSPYSSIGNGTQQVPPWAAIRVLGNGTVATESNQQATTVRGRWDGSDSNTTSSNTQVRFVVTRSSGIVTNGATNWVTIGASGRTISAEAIGPGINGQGFVHGRIEIRQIGTTSPVRSANISISANMSGGDVGNPL
ncbi:hypothetical protein [Aliidiomarina maris]|uniref:Uncharacterized protein n=1 Tax=Aliidiomarina maris TaxID=531312 RepID=A0A327X693_9GAMM|nr:hypothetical protein [Aliidiomarina maris]RAK01604.1 hypothetical protein B0I24_101227 [Aliidiomarina maris]RUO28430.1 hypothetical protein CWE07_01085 [Aliidiomarina maris]